HGVRVGFRTALRVVAARPPLRQHQRRRARSQDGQKAPLRPRAPPRAARRAQLTLTPTREERGARRTSREPSRRGARNPAQNSVLIPSEPSRPRVSSGVTPPQVKRSRSVLTTSTASDADARDKIPRM